MISDISRKTYNMASYFYSKFTSPPKENPRLDPLSTLVKLAILSKKPENTKLSLESNYITFTEPHGHWLIQATIRKIYGDSYNDLYYLTKTLHKAIEWYSSDENIKKIIKLSIIGLERLKQTYGKTGKANAVQSYIDILNEITNPTHDEGDSEKGSDSHHGTLDDVKLHQILKEVWSDNDIKIILGFFERMAESKNEEDIESSIKGIEVILQSNHKKIEDQVRILSSLE